MQDRSRAHEKMADELHAKAVALEAVLTKRTGKVSAGESAVAVVDEVELKRRMIALAVGELFGWPRLQPNQGRA